jgi:1-acyl-sn-glycerol-3-phosphate acyltransferase
LLFVWSVFTGIRYHIIGLEHINKKNTYVVVVNHVNAADMIAVAYGLRLPAKPLVKKELLFIPLLGQLFALACLPIDRSSKKARHESKLRLLNDLKHGISVVIFPEGTRNRSTNPLLPFYDGAFELAIEAQVPVVPVVLTNIKKINRVDTLLVQPGTLEVTYLTPINTIGLSMDDVQQLKDHVHKIMTEHILRNDSFFRKQSQDKQVSSEILHDV